MFLSDGTTDITRTPTPLGSPSLFQRQCFTRVLQGHIAVASSVFPKGTTGRDVMYECVGFDECALVCVLMMGTEWVRE